MANTGSENTTTEQTHRSPAAVLTGSAEQRLESVRVGRRLLKVSLIDIPLKNPGLIPTLRIVWINTAELFNQVLTVPKKSPETSAESKKINFWEINQIQKAHFHFQQK